MRRTITIPSDDYTATPFVEEIQFTEGERVLHALTLAVAGNIADAFVGVYRAASGKTSLTNAERAVGIIFSDDAVGASADPVPDLYVAADIEFTLAVGESLYVLLQPGAGDTAVSGTLSIEVR
jgi:hypothetical protein